MRTSMIDGKRVHFPFDLCFGFDPIARNQPNVHFAGHDHHTAPLIQCRKSFIRIDSKDAPFARRRQRESLLNVARATSRKDRCTSVPSYSKTEAHAHRKATLACAEASSELVTAAL